MKALRRLCLSLMLTLALALTAFAGGIETGITPPPPPPDAAATGGIETGVTGDMSTTAAGKVDTGATEVVLNLLQTVLSLF